MAAGCYPDDERRFPREVTYARNSANSGSMPRLTVVKIGRREFVIPYTEDIEAYTLCIQSLTALIEAVKSD